MPQNEVEKCYKVLQKISSFCLMLLNPLTDHLPPEGRMLSQQRRIVAKVD